jgi:hypothetical protein
MIQKRRVFPLTVHPMGGGSHAPVCVLWQHRAASSVQLCRVYRCEAVHEDHDIMSAQVRRPAVISLDLLRTRLIQVRASRTNAHPGGFSSQLWSRARTAELKH